MSTPNWLLDGRTGHVVILKAQDPDCLTGAPWGSDRCKAAVEAFNAALSLERPQYVLTYENGMVQAHVGCAADDALDVELGRAHQLGASSGYASAAAEVREAGVKMWKAGRDTEARFLRDLADQIDAKAKAMHPGKPEGSNAG